MPERDQHGRLGGFLEIEEFTDAWRKRFVLLDESKLKFFKGKDSVEESIDDPMKTIDLVYITKVAITTSKPKADYCFEIHTASEKCYLRSEMESEIETWFKALHKAAVNPKRDSDDEKPTRNIERGSGSVKSTGSNDSFDSESTVSYETKIIGGVPVRMPRTNAGDSDSMLGSRNNSGTADSLKPVKDGYCIKQGAVMKNWKRRYFRLDMFKFCYYEKETDKDPIRSLSATDLRGVKRYSGTTLHHKENVFEVETPQRTYYIQAESEEEMMEWIKAFKQVIRSIKGKSTLDSVTNAIR